jgi:cytoskeletal protein RodZ
VNFGVAKAIRRLYHYNRKYNAREKNMTESNKDLTASQMLYEARTSNRRKREISTISRLLCIREEYLIALENGDYHLIPEVVYILGFARNYAMELGLDPDEIVRKIKRELGLEDEFDSTSADDQESPKEGTHPVTAAHKAKQEKKAFRNTMFFEKVSAYTYKHWKWLLACLLALAVVIGAVVFMASLTDKTQVVNSPEIVEDSAKEPEYKQVVREKFGTENIATANVILQATQETWVKIEDARGNTVFSRVLVPGDVYYIPEGDKYKGTFGNAGGVDVWVNGKLAPKIGAIHARKTGVSMSPDSLMAAETTE